MRVGTSLRHCKIKWFSSLWVSEIETQSRKHNKKQREREREREREGFPVGEENGK